MANGRRSWQKTKTGDRGRIFAPELEQSQRFPCRRIRLVDDIQHRVAMPNGQPEEKTMLIVDWKCDKNVCNKIIELTENKKAALRERIPRKIRI